jgi:hypothetical protein
MSIRKIQSVIFQTPKSLRERFNNWFSRAAIFLGAEDPWVSSMIGLRSALASAQAFGARKVSSVA